jgi:FlaA1/EpsC-like NDP-sugar epimerase
MGIAEKTTAISRLMNHRTAIVLHDLGMVAAAWTLSYLIPYNFALRVLGLPFVELLPVVLVTQGVILWQVGLYRGVWRFASIPDLWNIMRAVTAGVVGVGIALFVANRLEGVPRTFVLLYPLLLFFLLGAPRMVYRMWKDHRFALADSAGRTRVLILGAGRAGEALARDLWRDGKHLVVGFLDDHLRLQGAKIRGFPVLGTLDELGQTVADMDVHLVVIAMPSASTAQMQRVVDLCERVGVPFRTLPRLHDLVSGYSSVNELREVAIDDLLGREPISLDWERISQGLRDKIVLISGGGGSIGSELCRQIARLGPRELVVIERNEFNLYCIEMALRRDFPHLVLHACLADVFDRGAVGHLMAKYRPQVIFHAAAYKHVPMLELRTREAIRNNVLGTRVLATAAAAHGCESFVLISTDKAVNPANIMGASKRMAEMICQGLDQRSTTRFITVRFGNVLGSAGSVVPLFQKQIASGGPVTVTHPKVTRYFMTIPEACQLIMQAAVMGRGGEIFVLDMGEPVSITYLAEQLIRLAGKVPGRDMQIVYTGLRPGEKLFEELFHSQENLSTTGHDKILLAQQRALDWSAVQNVLNDLERACDRYDEPHIAALVGQLVPELKRSGGQEPSTNVVALQQRNA